MVLAHIPDGSTCRVRAARSIKRVGGRGSELNGFIVRSGIIVSPNNVQVPGTKSGGLASPSGGMSWRVSGHGQMKVTLLMVVLNISIDIHAQRKHG